MVSLLRNGTPVFCLAGLMVWLLAGCAATPIDVSKRLLDAEPAMGLPLKGRAEILLPLGVADRRIVVDGGFPVVTLEDGHAITTAAREVFAKVFENVAVRGEIEDPQFVLKIKGEAEIEKVWAVFRTKVVVRLETGTKQVVGTFSAEGKARSGVVNDQVALENAYADAFLQAASALVNDPAFVELVWDGIPAGLVRPTWPPAERRRPEYEAIMRSVVTVRVVTSKAGSGKDEGLTVELAHGSGFFVNGDGMILTNQHVIGEGAGITVICDGVEYPARVVASDEWADLALLQVELMGSPFLKVAAERDAAAVGDEVVVVGSPVKSELDYSVSRGIVSSYRMMGGYSFLQTDAAINEGSSGGPVVSLKTGEVVGVVAMRYFGQGLGFALTSDVVTEFLGQNGIGTEE